MRRFVEVFSRKNEKNVEFVNLSNAFEIANDFEKQNLSQFVQKMYDGLYCQTFIIEEERENISVWLEMLEKGKIQGQHIYVAFGYNLSTENPDIIGFVVADIGGESNCGLIEYVVRKKGFSSVLTGNEMISYVEDELNKLNMDLNGCRLKGIFWEVNDPLKLGYNEQSPDETIDCMSPQKRIDLIKEKYGAKELGFSYVQVPLQKCISSAEVDERTCTKLRFFLFNADAYPTLTAQDVKDYICYFNTVVNGSKHPRDLNNPEIDKMMDELDVMINHSIPILLENQTSRQRALIAQASDLVKFNN